MHGAGQVSLGVRGRPPGYQAVAMAASTPVQPPRRRSLPAYLGAKVFELTLIGLWFCFAFLSSSEQAQVKYLVAWDLVAATYLLLGFIAVKRRGGHSAPIRPAEVAPVLRPMVGPKFEFGCILAASVAGLTSAIAVVSAHHADVQVAGSLAIVLAWTLLNAGYARFYAGLCQLSTSSRPPLEFPANPGLITSTDYFYFAFTIGTSFAVSDITVTTPEMRWHVMVHSVLSFFFNAAVLAVAIGILTEG